MSALLLAASILVGECGPLGFDCELAVARTVANRMADDRWPADLEDVLKAYYAYSAPTDTALVLGYVLATMPQALADGEHYYAYSDADRARMGWAAGDATVCGHGLCVHLAESWMGG